MYDSKVQGYMNAAIDSMSVGREKVREALAAIAEQKDALTKRSMGAQPYQLLALRRYLRTGGAKLLANWPWTIDEQKGVYKDVITDLKRAAAATKRNFEAANRGLVLEFTGARSLDRQAFLWVNNDSCLRAALNLMDDARTELAKSQYLPTPTAQAAAAFSEFLETYRFGRGEEPTNAAPGLSDHGQMKAVDFIVYQGGKKVADIKQALIKSQWTNTGYADKLKKAIEGTGLDGPLRTPYEPWHYSIRIGH